MPIMEPMSTKVQSDSDVDTKSGESIAEMPTATPPSFSVALLVRTSGPTT